jgi:hypothetical protein
MTIQPRPSPPVFSEELGTCQWIVRPESNDECGLQGVIKVRVDTRVVPAMIVLCTKHKAENNQKHAERRQKK